MTTDYTHPDYDALAPKWRRIRDAVAGEDAVKAAAEAYLPRPNKFDTSPEAADRYDAYLQRAVYYNAVGRTLSGLVGVAFANWPEVVTSERVLLDDADGSGVGLIGQSQWMLAEVLQTGRGGLLTDASFIDPSKRPRIKTVADAEAAGLRTFISAYRAEDILTWELSGAVLTRLVLREVHADHAGGKVELRPQLRELVIEEGKVIVKMWRRYSATGQFMLAETRETTAPTIPFAFVGATNNDAHPDQPPLLDLANLNLAHYRNSADYEESAFLLGQPMFAVSGVDEEWVNARMASGMYVGARAMLPLPQGGDAKILQVAPNTLAKEAMDNKERQMQALGARLMAQGEVAKTATQSAAETKAAYSVLSLACDNVSQAYTRALGFVEAWWGRPAGKASFAIDTRFNDLTLDANAIGQVVAAWQAGLVPQTDAWAVLRRLGVIEQGKTDDQLAGEIEGQGVPLRLDEAA